MKGCLKISFTGIVYPKIVDLAMIFYKCLQLASESIIIYAGGDDYAKNSECICESGT